VIEDQKQIKELLELTKTIKCNHCQNHGKANHFHQNPAYRIRGDLLLACWSDEKCVERTGGSFTLFIPSQDNPKLIQKVLPNSYAILCSNCREIGKPSKFNPDPEITAEKTTQLLCPNCNNGKDFSMLVGIRLPERKI
jgi:hypothetical protein